VPRSSHDVCFLLRGRGGSTRPETAVRVGSY
jgi:hypothetical protein